MIAYLIKSTLCLLVLGSFYKLFLEKEKIHNLKRYYLIVSILFAYTIPLITITYEKEVYINPQDIVVASEAMVTPGYVTEVYDVTAEPINYVPILLWSLYSIGFIIFGFRFTKNLYSLTKKVRSNEKLKEPSHTNVLLRDAVIPFTFLKYIFVPKTEFLQRSIPEEVLFHEKAHVHQKHTLDILFVEVLQVIFWFNPLLFWLKKAIKLNHEFLADQTVLKHQFSIQRYVNLLVNYPTSSNQTALTSTINYSLTKKRLQMMTKEFSKKRVTLKLLAVIPTLLLCLLFFNNDIIAQEKNNWRYSKTNSSQDKEIEIRVKNEQIRVNGSSVTLDNLSKTIDDITKQWKDDELTGFNFDVKLQNVDQKFVDSINKEYRSTRLYKANPDGHDLVPPKPPMPPSPKVRRGESSDIPPPPAPKVRKGEKSTIPTPPTPPKAPSYEESESEEEEEMQELLEEVEEARLQSEVEYEEGITNNMGMASQARLAAVEAREAAEEARARALEQVKIARAQERGQIRIRTEAVEEAREQAQLAREMAAQNAEEAREVAEKARVMAMEAAQRVSQEMAQVRNLSRNAAKEARAMALEAAQKSREIALEEREKVRELILKERVEAEKEREMFMKRSRKEREQLRKEAQKAMEAAKKEAEKARKEMRKEIKRNKKDRN